MKQTDKMSRAIGQLEKMFSVINAEKFGGELPQAILTVSPSKGKSYGHSTCNKVWYNGEKSQYEINIASEFLNAEIECTLDTLIHEMIHLYCRVKDIKETSRGGHYHNKKFKELAEEKGLKVFMCGNAGWNTDHRGNDYLTKYAIEHEWYEIKIGRTYNPFSRLGLSGSGTPTPQANTETETATPSTSSTIKYKCPKCGCKIRATKNLDGKLKCIDCDEIFTRA